jgi:ATP-binding cassette subfamily G (WHITE) protein 2 (SNQ2)
MKEARQAGSLRRTIIEDSFGCVRPGEMLLVLARPGGGATTLLRLLSNQRKGYTDIEGDVRFGSMTPKEIRGFRGQVVMNGEEVSTLFPELAALLTRALFRRSSSSRA